MNRDLEAQFAEMGPEFAGLSSGLCRAVGAGTSPDFTARVMAEISLSERRRRVFRAGWWAAAAAAVVAVFAIHGLTSGAKPALSGLDRLVASQRADGTFSVSSAASYVQAFAVQALADSHDERARAALESAVAALVRSQSGEGGWSGDMLTSYNVAALAAAEAAGVESARIPLRRGLRYLRANGISECPAGALGKAAAEALDRMAGGGDLVVSVSRIGDA